jgi:hypothetical protein
MSKRFDPFALRAQPRRNAIATFFVSAKDKPQMTKGLRGFVLQNKKFPA